MNTQAKKELAVLLGLGSITALFFKRPKAAAGLALGATALAISNLKKPDSFEGKSVVITGGSRGLGLALARQFVLEGANVSLLARDFKELERAKGILKLHGATKEQVMVCPCDITDDEQLIKTLNNIIMVRGEIDVLVNNAGAIIVGPFDSMSMEDFEAQMKLHLFANISLTKKVLPHFRRRGEGRIINICSMGGKVAVPHMLPYDSSKFALAGFSQGITAELAQENISVTTVYPALMRTGSPIQAVFKGDAKKEFSWFANSDVFPWLSMDANVAAQKIVEASRQRRTELIPSTAGQARMMIGAFFPEIMSYTMNLVNRFMPKGNMQRYKTGAQCLTDKTYISESFEKTSRDAEEDLNQEPKDDPEFNLGLH